MSLNFCNNNSLSAITALPASISGGGLNLISTQTASSSSTIDFTSGIDSTYKEYIFKYINIHPANDGQYFQVNFRDGGSSFDSTKTTSAFEAYHNEAGTGQTLQYLDGEDLAQSTSFQNLTSIDSDNDATGSGTLHLFDPSNTTFVKHFLANINCFDNNVCKTTYIAGYCNTTSAIDGVQFKMSSGNIDSGVIKLYGVS